MKLRSGVLAKNNKQILKACHALECASTYEQSYSFQQSVHSMNLVFCVEATKFI